MTRSYATSPAKAIATRGRGETCWVCLATLGGGLVGGDEIALTADVDVNARALVTTQASTKVYRSMRRASQTISARVADGALLAVVPDPVVCFAGADFTQVQRYELDEDATLVMLDWFTSGRHASGERWAFHRYESRFRVTRGGRGIFLDAVVLDANLDTVADRMTRYDAFVTALVTGPLVSAAVTSLLGSVNETSTNDAELLVSIVKLRDGGAMIRMAGTSLERIIQAVRSRLAFLTPLVGDDVWSRKW